MKALPRLEKEGFIKLYQDKESKRSKNKDKLKTGNRQQVENAGWRIF
jgi:hypothetical protein